MRRSALHEELLQDVQRAHNHKLFDERYRTVLDELEGLLSAQPPSPLQGGNKKKSPAF